MSPSYPAESATPLAGSWALAGLPAGAAGSPQMLEEAGAEWLAIPGPETVAAAYRRVGTSHLLRGRDLDDDDWWFRCRFVSPHAVTAGHLLLDGLATVADVWLNGAHLLRSENMFVAHDLPLMLRRGENELHFQFHALNPLLTAKRPRGRWRTRLVSRQQLRWHRTTLLGRIQEWCPPVAPVGPWRSVRVIPLRGPRVAAASLLPAVEGTDGVVEARVRLDLPDDGSLPEVFLMVGSARVRLDLRGGPPGGMEAGGVLRVPGIERWWPHTHGNQPLYSARVTLTTGGDQVDIPLGRVGFRTLGADRGADGQGFGLRVNGEEIFCRGACWTPLDLVGLGAEPAEYRSALLQARRAGMNMLRVGGTMVYEADAFYDACDELGILVWQDFMFANMDYPSGDAAFTRSVETEARQLLGRLAGRPSLAVLCGGSEVEQQAAMLGLSAAERTGGSADETLSRCVAEMAPAIPWVSSSPTGGTHPFQSNTGVAHYYGVGAYLRPLEDARRAGVRFASECLAFAHVPDLDLGQRTAAEMDPRHPGWKAGVPRDPGSEWDFEDVRDHYLALLFGVDPRALREQDPSRYLALAAVTTGEVMERTIGEWRRPGSTARGALVWLLRDFLPGAGWGIVDSAGRPKPAWWYLRRAFAPVALLTADEGLNGLYYHAVNDTAVPVEAELQVTVYRNGQTPVARAQRGIVVPPRGAVTVHADALFPGFLDLTYAYRFGPPGHDVIGARLMGPRGEQLGSTFHWPVGWPKDLAPDLGLTASAAPHPDGYLLTLESQRVAFGVAIHAADFDPGDNWFHLEPATPRTILLQRAGVPGPLRGTVSAVNGTAPIVIPVAAS